MRLNHLCFDHERYSHKDAGWEVWVCSKCGSEHTYIPRSPYNIQGKTTDFSLSSEVDKIGKIDNNKVMDARNNE